MRDLHVAVVGASGLVGREILRLLDERTGSPGELRLLGSPRTAGGTVQEGGTGLGLAIVKAIAGRHGAQVALDEAPAGGLRVAVRFPAAA